MASDPLDQAAELSQQLNDAALENHRLQQKAKALPPSPYCYNCSELVEGGDSFCDADCMEDFYYIQERKEANNR